MATAKKKPAATPQEVKKEERLQRQVDSLKEQVTHWQQLAAQRLATIGKLEEIIVDLRLQLPPPKLNGTK